MFLQLCNHVPDGPHETSEEMTDKLALDKMRTFCHRVLVHGPRGMGQKHLGSAVLHHLEGFHVQTLDLGTLMGDSAKVRLVST